MILDKIEYSLDKQGLRKVVTNITYVKELKLEYEALTAQLSDLKAGTTETPEDQAVIDEAVKNYEEQVVILQTELSKNGISS